MKPLPTVTLWGFGNSLMDHEITQEYKSLDFLGWINSLPSLDFHFHLWLKAQPHCQALVAPGLMMVEINKMPWKKWSIIKASAEIHKLLLLFYLIKKLFHYLKKVNNYCSFCFVMIALVLDCLILQCMPMVFRVSNYCWVADKILIKHTPIFKEIFTHSSCWKYILNFSVNYFCPQVLS